MMCTIFKMTINHLRQRQRGRRSEVTVSYGLNRKVRDDEKLISNAFIDRQPDARF